MAKRKDFRQGDLFEAVALEYMAPTTPSSAK